MATSLDYIKECSVCTLEFTDPQILPCDHSFCKRCTDRLKKGVKIKCPVCNKIHDIKRVRYDFRLTQIIDALKEGNQQSKNESTKQGEPCCGMCSSESAHCWCEDCQQWMCKGCTTLHFKIPICKTNTTSSLQQKCKEVKAEYNRISKGMEELFEEYDKAVLKVETDVMHLENIQATALKRANDVYETLIKDIKALFESVDNQILLFLEDSINSLNENKKRLIKDTNEMRSQWKTLSDMVSNNMGRLATEGDFILKQSHSKLSMKNSIAVQMKYPSIHLSANTMWNPKSVVELHFRDGNIIHHLSKLQRKPLALKNSTSISSIPWCISVIGNQIWIGQEDGTVEILNKELSLQMRFDNKLWEIVNSIVDLPKGITILATSTGLYEINWTGTQLCKIEPGYFRCATFHSDMLFAYATVKGQIKVYTKNEIWKVERTIQNIAPLGGAYTLAVNDNAIALCCATDGKTYIYSHDGAIVEILGEKGSECPGKFKRPYICCQDPQGSMLFADRENNCLQLLKNNTEFSIVNLEPSIIGPTSAVFYEQKLYIVSPVESKLYEYGFI